MCTLKHLSRSTQSRVCLTLPCAVYITWIVCDFESLIVNPCILYLGSWLLLTQRGKSFNNSQPHPQQVRPCILKFSMQVIIYAEKSLL